MQPCPNSRLDSAIQPLLLNIREHVNTNIGTHIGSAPLGEHFAFHISISVHIRSLYAHVCTYRSIHHVIIFTSTPLTPYPIADVDGLAEAWFHRPMTYLGHGGFSIGAGGGGSYMYERNVSMLRYHSLFYLFLELHSRLRIYARRVNCTYSTLTSQTPTMHLSTTTRSHSARVWIMTAAASTGAA